MKCKCQQNCTLTAKTLQNVRVQNKPLGEKMGLSTVDVLA